MKQYVPSFDEHLNEIKKELTVFNDLKAGDFIWIKNEGRSTYLYNKYRIKEIIKKGNDIIFKVFDELKSTGQVFSFKASWIVTKEFYLENPNKKVKAADLQRKVKKPITSREYDKILKQTISGHKNSDSSILFDLAQNLFLTNKGLVAYVARENGLKTKNDVIQRIQWDLEGLTN